ncbi:MAG: hypothetical protein ACRD3N_08565 [Terracidiphilus sp.]
MRSKIFSLVLAPALLAAAAFTSNPAQAATRLTVPFSFSANGKVCPAGTYIVSRDITGYFVTLGSVESPQRNFLWLMGPGAVDPADNRVTLEFDDIGTSHALRSIRYGSMVTSRLDGKPAGGRRVLAESGMGQ